MVFSNEDNDTKIVKVNCSCGCDEELQIRRYKFEEALDIEDDYYISIHTSKFYNQRGIIRTILHRCRLALLMLLGKEYLLCDIVMKKAELEEFRKKLGEL